MKNSSGITLLTLIYLP